MIKTKFKVIGYLLYTAMLLSFIGAAAGEGEKNNWVAPETTKTTVNPMAKYKDNDRILKAGKKLYDAQCLTCHGDLGKGDGASAQFLDPHPKDLTADAVQNQTDGEIFWKITTGKSPMPTFETLVNENQRWMLVNYVRSLKQK